MRFDKDGRQLRKQIRDRAEVCYVADFWLFKDPNDKSSIYLPKKFLVMTLMMKDPSSFIDVEQAHKILDAARSRSQRLYLLMKVLWIAGVRVSELLTIRPCDLEYDTNMIRIMKAKGGKQRRVAHPGINMLTELREYIDEKRIAKGAPIFQLGRR